MKLSVLVPTYNRAERLRETLKSLADAAVPEGLQIEIFVIDNNSTDATKMVVEEMRPEFSHVEYDYVFEPRQGKSFALNNGVRRSTGDIITGIDDDIVIRSDWFIAVESLFRERKDLDFAGGKILPTWEEENIPEWIDPLKDGVLGWRDYGDREWDYDENSPILTGGHWVIRRKVFGELGLFPEGIGATGKNLMSCEDDVFYYKLLDAGKKGIYCPRFVFFHFIPKYRVSKKYFRHWCFGIGMSQSVMEAQFKAYEGAKIFRVPRYLYREAIRGLGLRIKNLVSGSATEALENEKSVLIFAGYFFERNLSTGILNKPLRLISRVLISPASR